MAVYTETRRLRRASQVTNRRDVHLRPKEQPVLKELTGLGMWALVEGAGWREIKARLERRADSGL